MNRNFLGAQFLLLMMTVSTFANRMENNIRNELFRHLGIKTIPQRKHANISADEYTRMLGIYSQSVQQTKALRKLKTHFDKHVENTQHFQDIVLYSESGFHRRKKRSLSREKDLFVLNFNSSIFPSFTLVNSAKLSVKLNISEQECKVSAIQVIEESADGINLDTFTSNSDFNQEIGDRQNVELIELDLSHAFQSWILKPQTNKGIHLISEGCEVISSDTKLSVHLDLMQLKGRPRQKRSQQKPTKKHPKTCGKRQMKIKFEDLEGFDFIYMPREFDASFCKGRCPPRYKPMNDHSLLQSLMYIKSERTNNRRRRSPKVKRPCCSPSKFESLDILHLDEEDPTRLKVTNWKNIKVSQCACA